MKNLILSLALCLVFCVSTVQAQNAITPFQLVLIGNCDSTIRNAGIPISGLSIAPGTLSASTVTANFLPSATDLQKTAAEQIILAFPWGLNQPDVVGFITAVNADPLATANNGQLVFDMAGMLAIFQADMTGNNFVALQGHWANAILLYGPGGSAPGAGWLTTQVQTMLLGYANQYNIPLVSTTPALKK